jgi:hypothetical protein
MPAQRCGIAEHSSSAARIDLAQPIGLAVGVRRRAVMDDYVFRHLAARDIIQS